jgi:hypothetical protein
MTNFFSNIDDVIAKFRGLKGSINPSEALLVGVNAARGQMAFRIFNKGIDAEGKPLGPYSGKKTKRTNRKFKSPEVKKRIVGSQSIFSPYELKRVSHGRQIRFKDEEFTGDLRRAIKVIKQSESLVVCAITNDQLARIADFQEIQIQAIRNGTKPSPGGPKAKVFELSEDERKLLIENTREALKQIYVRVLNS